MFRLRRALFACVNSSPHARGDVPRSGEQHAFLGCFSPRPWGCSDAHVADPPSVVLLPTPVGMFLTADRCTSSNRTSPHARGDVPQPRRRVLPDALFSPRPWGCSALLGPARQSQALLPTPVGMFRASSMSASDPTASPHARGDVPATMKPNCRRPAFSPRPWGCSARRSSRRNSPPLLPTPVGMFRACPSSIVGASTSPHARGDVPRRSRER